MTGSSATWRHPDAEAQVTRLRFGILGPLEVVADGRMLDVGPRKQQLILAALLCHPNSTVSVDSLTDMLWTGEPPRTARKNIQVYVSALRRLLGPVRPENGAGSRISHRLAGYVIHVHPAEMDSLCFEQQMRARQHARRSEQATAVARALAESLSLWRGPVLPEMRDIPLLSATVQQLDRQFLVMFEDWAEAEIAAGDALRSIERINDMAHRHPVRERLRMLQMTALTQAGRRSEALAAYEDLRQSLAHLYGLSPSETVAGLYRAMLRDGGPARPTVRPNRDRAPRCLLPRDLPSFTGREKCGGQLAFALTDAEERTAVLTGPTGTGKTRLAVHVAHQLGEYYPDGRVFIRIRGPGGAPRSLPEICAELQWKLAGTTQPGQNGHDHAWWEHWLAEHRVLIVLDDAPRESLVWPVLPEVGESAVIVTSRQRLAGLEPAFRLRVPPFTLAEAIGLLERVLGTDRVAADRRSAERIALATGLLPLAVRLIAERLAWLRHVPLRDYLARIEDSSALLDELTAGDVSIRARLAEAVEDMPGPARHAFPFLGSLPPAFTLAQAATALGMNHRSAERVLEMLMEAGIVTVPETGQATGAVDYQLPVLAYLYARETAADHRYMRHDPLAAELPAPGVPAPGRSARRG